MTAELGHEASLDLVALDAIADAAMAGPAMRQRLTSWRDAAGCVPNDHVWPCRCCLFDLTLGLARVATAGKCPHHPEPTP